MDKAGTVGSSPGTASPLTAREGASGETAVIWLDHHQERKFRTYKPVARVKVSAWLLVLFAVVCWLSFRIEQIKLSASQEMPDATQDQVLEIRNLLYIAMTVTCALCSTIRIYCKAASNKWSHKLRCPQGNWMN